MYDLETAQKLTVDGNIEDLKRIKTQIALFRKGKQPSEPFAVSAEIAGKDGKSQMLESGTALSLLNSLARAQRAIKYREALDQRQPNTPIIVSEGDSWFQYPLPDPVDIIDVVSRTYPVRSLGSASHRLKDVLHQQEISRVLDEEGAHILLLSAGGNDLLGRANGKPGILRFLRPVDGQNTSLEFIDWRVAEQELDALITAYEELLRETTKQFPRVGIILHGYDKPIPNDGGAWLGGPMGAHGIPEPYWRPISDALFESFNDRLSEMAEGFGGQVRYLDLRSLVGGSRVSWHDELHPVTTAVVKRLAPKFLDAIKNIPERLATKPHSVERKPNRDENMPPSDGQFSREKLIPNPEPADVVNIRNLRLVDQKQTSGTKSDANCACRPFSSVESARRTVIGTRENICASVDLWQQELGEENRDIYAAVAELSQEIDEPDDAERVEVWNNLGPLRHVDALPLPSTGDWQERIIGGNDLDGIGFLERGIECQKAVCRVVARDNNRQPDGLGTGFLVGDGLLITNNHVLSEKHREQSYVEFDYQRKADGQPMRRVRFDITDEIFVTSEELDYTLISIEHSNRDGIDISDYGWIRMLHRSGKALKKHPVGIIQHPGGGEKMLALFNSHVIGTQGNFIYYTTDTEGGSSGSPVFSKDWLLAALHHRTVPHWFEPCTFVANRGVRISKICEHIDRLAAENHASAEAARALIYAEPDQKRETSRRSAPRAEKAGRGPSLPPLAVRNPRRRIVNTRIQEDFLGDKPVLVEDADLYNSVFKFVSRIEGNLIELNGTCFAVRPDLVLTAAHNMAHLNDGNKSDHRIDIHLWNGSGWDDFGDNGFHRYFLDSPILSSTYDLAAIAIPDKFPHHLAIRAATPADIGKTIQVTGFPEALFGGQETLVDGGDLIELNENLIIHSVSADNGQSGAPITIIDTDGIRRAIGIHLGGSDVSGVSGTNGGVAFTEEIIEEFTKWTF